MKWPSVTLSLVQSALFECGWNLSDGITPVIMLCYMVKGRLFWVVLTSSRDPFKSGAFSPGGHRGRNQWDMLFLAGLKESKLLCCELPIGRDGLLLLTVVPKWQPERKQGSQSNLKGLNLANNLNELRSGFFPQSLQKGVQPGWYLYSSRPWAQNTALLCLGFWPT